MRLEIILTLALLGTCAVGPRLSASEKAAARRVVRPLKGAATEKVLHKPAASSAVGALPSLSKKSPAQQTNLQAATTQIVPNAELPQIVPRARPNSSESTAQVPPVLASAAPQSHAARPLTSKTSKSDASVRRVTMPAPTAQHLAPLAAATLPATKPKP
jgi:hypothetical protein